MSLTFDDVWQYTSTVPGWFTEANCHALFDACSCFTDQPHFVEIGCWAGRSSSILLQWAQHVGGHVTLIDPFVWQEGEAWPAFREYVLNYFPPRLFDLYMYGSATMNKWVRDPVQLLHIDGDHTFAGIETDCTHYLPKLVSGGIVCAHDYDNPAYPDIKPVLDRHTEGWEDLGVYETLAIRRKP